MNGNHTLAASAEPITYSISGRISMSTGGLANWTVYAGSASAITDSSGNYTITGLANGSYTVAPDSTGDFIFNPTQQSVTISGADVTGVNFGAILPPKGLGPQAQLIGPVPGAGSGVHGRSAASMNEESQGNTGSSPGSGDVVLQPTPGGNLATCSGVQSGFQVNRPSGGHGGPNARGGAREVYYGAEQTMDTPAPKASITVPAAPANEDTRYYVCDHLGTARVVMNQAGTVVERHDFEPFGVEIMPYQNTADNSHQYTGQERDAATQMDYMHFRYYGSNLGRFMKPDNVMGNAMNPQDWNRYSYVHGNPVNFNDPTGHQSSPGPVGSPGSQHPGAYPDGGIGNWWLNEAESAGMSLPMPDLQPQVILVLVTTSTNADGQAGLLETGNEIAAEQQKANPGATVLVRQVGQRSDVADSIKEARSDGDLTGLYVVGHASQSQPTESGRIQSGVIGLTVDEAVTDGKHTATLQQDNRESMLTMQDLAGMLGTGQTGLTVGLYGCHTGDPGLDPRLPSLAADLHNLTGATVEGVYGPAEFPFAVRRDASGKVTAYSRVVRSAMFPSTWLP